jgi:hypothetical protein
MVADAIFVHFSEIVNARRDGDKVVIEVFAQVINTEVFLKPLGTLAGQVDLPRYIRRSAELQRVDNDIPFGHADTVAQAGWRLQHRLPSQA